jgi:hypothetical protein
MLKNKKAFYQQTLASSVERQKRKPATYLAAALPLM